jgi:nucleotide-binding universal stress UspA family protein
METILVPTDFSLPSKNAVNYAVELAKFFSARLIFLNVYSYPPADYETGFSALMTNSLQEGSINALEELKKEILEKNQYSLKIECICDMGLPFDRIEHIVESHDIDIVVMGITGEAGKLKEHLIGSTAVKVARNLDIPVFIIPENIKYHRIHKIAFACDMDKTEETAVIYNAKYFGKVFDADMEIINIEEPGNEMLVEHAKTDFYIEEKLKTINHKTVFVKDKHPAHGLREYFKTHTADLIMLNPKKHDLFHKLFNESVTKELAFHAHLPILTIH